MLDRFNVYSLHTSSPSHRHRQQSLGVIACAETSILTQQSLWITVISPNSTEISLLFACPSVCTTLHSVHYRIMTNFPLALMRVAHRERDKSETVTVKHSNYCMIHR